jgi:hypothetical protein
MLVQVTVYWQLLASIHGYVLPHARTRRVDRVGRVGVRGPATSPLTLAVAVTSWTPDLVAVTLIVLAALCYSQWYRRGHAAAPGRAWCFGAGLALCGIATLSVIAVYAPVLFWMRALQVLLLMFVAPFLLGALGEAGRGRLDRVLSSAAARVVCSPLTTSVAMLATPCRAREVDVELDVDLDEDSPPASTLWWQTDPELRERFDRH